MKELQIIRLKTLVQLLGISRSTFYMWINPRAKQFKPNFPAKIKISARCVGWRLREIEQWMDTEFNQPDK
ncbi:UNVERIFIED_CONTAM: AlpA family phage regulatory protein [Aeromonas hydrophila]